MVQALSPRVPLPSPWESATVQVEAYSNSTISPPPKIHFQHQAKVQRYVLIICIRVHTYMLAQERPLDFMEEACPNMDPEALFTLPPEIRSLIFKHMVASTFVWSPGAYGVRRMDSLRLKACARILRANEGLAAELMKCLESKDLAALLPKNANLDFIKFYLNQLWLLSHPRKLPHCSQY